MSDSKSDLRNISANADCRRVDRTPLEQAQDWERESDTDSDLSDGALD